MWIQKCYVNLQNIEFHYIIIVLRKLIIFAVENTISGKPKIMQ